MNIRVPLLVALVSLCGCSQTQQISRSAPLAKDVKGSGFLGDLYPKMQDGEGDQGLRIYRSPAFQNPAEFAQFTRVLLEPVVMYAAKDSKLAEVSAEEREHIADAVYAQIYDKLSSDYEMTTDAGANTLKLEVAVVDAEGSWATAEALSYLPVPVGIPGAKIALVQLDKLATGKPPFAGAVTVEGRLSDAQSGEVLSAMIDRRVGTRRPLIGLFESDTYDSWADVDQAIRYFAERLRYRLCLRRGGTNCIEPKS